MPETPPPASGVPEKDAEPIIQRSLTEVVAGKIKDMIVSGELTFGQQVTERGLSDRFGVSKTPIREALLLLASEGLIEIKPRTGTFVLSLTCRQISQITELRRLLESGALRSAMRHDPEGLLAALRRNLDKCEAVLGKPDPADEYRDLDSQFHALFFEFADNPYMGSAYDVIACTVKALRSRLTFPESFIRGSIEQHQEVVRLLAAGHIGQAVTQLEYHVAASFSDRAKRLLAGRE